MNKQLIENLKTKSLVTPQRIEDHMNFSELSPKIIKIFIDEKSRKPITVTELEKQTKTRFAKISEA